MFANGKSCSRNILVFVKHTIIAESFTSSLINFFRNSLNIQMEIGELFLFQYCASLYHWYQHAFVQSISCESSLLIGDIQVDVQNIHLNDDRSQLRNSISSLQRWFLLHQRFLSTLFPQISLDAYHQEKEIKSCVWPKYGTLEPWCNGNDEISTVRPVHSCWKKEREKSLHSVKTEDLPLYWVPVERRPHRRPFQQW